MNHKLIAIMAMTSDEVIAINDKLPIKSKEDMKHFKNTTINETVLMGRKTFDTLGKALPHRDNIVVSRNKIINKEPNVYYTDTILKALHHATTTTNDKDIYVIGGSEIYKQLVPLCDEFYLTVFHGFAEYNKNDKVTFSPYTHQDIISMFNNVDKRYIDDGIIYHYTKE